MTTETVIQCAKWFGVSVLAVWALVLAIGVAEVLIAAARRRWRHWQMRRLIADVRRRELRDRRIGRPD